MLRPARSTRGGDRGGRIPAWVAVAAVALLLLLVFWISGMMERLLYPSPSPPPQPPSHSTPHLLTVVTCGMPGAPPTGDRSALVDALAALPAVAATIDCAHHAVGAGRIETDLVIVVGLGVDGVGSPVCGGRCDAAAGATLLVDGVLAGLHAMMETGLVAVPLRVGGYDDGATDDHDRPWVLGCDAYDRLPNHPADESCAVAQAAPRFGGGSWEDAELPAYDRLAACSRY